MNGSVLYFSHGGGPLPLLGDQGHQKMVSFLTGLSGKIKRPDAIIVISAHWEESVPTVITAEHPPLFYDYYGFPEESYSIEYPVSGLPPLAEEVRRELSKNHIETKSDSKRGFDHGVFIPLKLLYPEARIPCIQLSLVQDLDPLFHLAMGRALTNLLQKNILIIGSGFSFHNMSRFSWNGETDPDLQNDQFQDWLIKVCTSRFSAAEREEKLAQWEQAPFARYCHPREEHLLPLHVCAAAAGIPAELLFDDFIAGKRSVAFYWS